MYLGVQFCSATSVHFYTAIDRVPLLLELFGNDMGMTPAIMQEIAAPIDYGYEFPLSVINTIKSVQMNT